MPFKQTKINNNIGRDTHTRNSNSNFFKQQASMTFQMLAGEIEITEPEPLFRQNMVTVSFARGGRATDVAYPGAFIDPITGNLHGSYEGPIPGQMVMVGFEDGNSNAPFVVNRFPYQGVGDTFAESSYITPLTRTGFDSTDVLIGHFSGSLLSFNTGILSGKLPGSVTLNAVTDFDVITNSAITLDSLLTMELTSTLITLSGSTAIELNGNTNFAVKYNELKTAFDLLRTELNNFITIFNAHIHPTPSGPSSPTATPGTPATADMSAAQNTSVLM